MTELTVNDSGVFVDGVEIGGGGDLSAYQLKPAEGAFVNGDKTKLDGLSSNNNDLYVADYADFETALSAASTGDTVIAEAGESYAISAANISMLNGLHIKSDTEGSPFTLTWAAHGSFDTTGRLRVSGTLGSTATSINASIVDSERISCTAITVSNSTNTLTITVTLSRAPRRTITTGQYYLLQSFYSSTAANSLLLTMIDSNEGMDLTHPYSITRISDTSFSYQKTIPNWITSTQYYTNQVVYDSGVFYTCLEDHISSTFATDLAALKWSAITLAPHTSPTSIGAFENDQFLYMTSTTGFSTYDMLQLYSSDKFCGFNGGVQLNLGQVVEVGKVVDGNWIRLRQRAEWDFINTVEVKKITPLENASLTDCVIVGKGINSAMTNYGQVDKGVFVSYTRDCTFTRVIVRDCPYMCFLEIYSLRNKYIKCQSDQVSENNGGAKFGKIDIEYGFVWGNCATDTQYIDCIGFFGRHNFDESCLSGYGPGLSLGQRLIRCTGIHPWSQNFATHDMYKRLYIEEPLCIGGQGINLRNGNATIVNPTCINSENGVDCYGQINDIRIVGKLNCKGIKRSALNINPAQYMRLVKGGTGYTVGDILTFSGGTNGGTPATCRVATVSSGVITSIDTFVVGDYSYYPPATVDVDGLWHPVTGGTGSEAKIRLNPYDWEYDAKLGYNVALSHKVSADEIISDGDLFTVSIYCRDKVHNRNINIDTINSKNSYYYSLYSSGLSSSDYGHSVHVKHLRSEDFGSYPAYLDTPRGFTIDTIEGIKTGDFTELFIVDSGTNDSEDVTIGKSISRSKSGGTITLCSDASAANKNFRALDRKFVGKFEPITTGYYRKPNTILVDRSATYVSQASGYYYISGFFSLDRPILLTEVMGGINLGVGATTCRFGISKVDPETMQPSTVVWDSGEQTHSTSTANWTETVSDLRLNPGIYCEIRLVNGGTVQVSGYYMQGVDSSLIKPNGSGSLQALGYSYSTGSKLTSTAIPDNVTASNFTASSIADLHCLFLKYTEVDPL